MTTMMVLVMGAVGVNKRGSRSNSSSSSSSSSSSRNKKRRSTASRLIMSPGNKTDSKF